MSQSVPVLRPAIGDDQLPAGLSHLQRFKLAAAAGFEGVEMRTSLHSDEVDEIRETAITAGIQIHSVKSVLSWQFPLSSPDRKVAARGVDELLIALNNAHRWGADTVLVVAGIVDAQTSHEQAYVRSQEIIRREVLPVAEELGIVLAIENVWSGFLISPVEYARYIDEFDSPWVRAYLDVGNMIFGYPEHWVRTVGARTIKLHIKDFSFEMAKKRFAWSLIGQGSIDWAAVFATLAEVGFSGWATNTGLPKSFFALQCDRGARLMQRLGISELPVIGHAMRLVQQFAGARSLEKIAHHFERLRAGGLARQ